MNTVEKAQATQLANIEKRTGKTLDQFRTIIKQSGLTKHREILAMLKRDLGMGHGDANALALQVLKSAEPKTEGDPLDEIYSGAKAELRPIHDALTKQIAKLGKYEEAPKKTYISLRRKKQFAMIGPATKTQVEVGLNMKGVTASERLVALPAGGMCQYKVRVSSANEIDKELLAWIKIAYDSAG